METLKRFLPEVGNGGFTHSFKVTHADLTETTANTAQVIPLYTTKKGTLILDAAFILKTAFKDASDAAFNSNTISIGIGGAAASFLPATEINEKGTEVLAFVTTNATDTLPGSFVGADTIDLTVNSMSGKSLSDIDTGEVIIMLRICELGDL
jgi:hypothetical protein